MKQALLMLATALVVGAVSFWVGYSLLHEDEISRLQKRMQRTRALVDSLQQVNNQLRNEIEQLGIEEQGYVARIDTIKEAVRQRERRIQELVEQARIYAGSSDELLRELNRLIHTELPVLPDSSAAR